MSEQEVPSQPIRVLIADDHHAVRQVFAIVLSQEPDIEVVGQAFDGQMAVDLAAKFRPDVVLMDLTMPRLNGIEATRAIMSRHPGVRVIGLSMHDSQDVAGAMREAGAVAYLGKDAQTEEIIAAIRAA